MELKLIPTSANVHPVVGFFIKGKNPNHWVKELQRMQVALHKCKVYALPGSHANSIWGCVVFTTDVPDTSILLQNKQCLEVCKNFYVPENSTVSPTISATDAKLLFAGKKAVMHPDFGYFELQEQLYFDDYIHSPTEKFRYIFQPAESQYTPHQVRSFSVKEVDGDKDVFEKLQEEVAPKPSKKSMTKLNPFEKAKLAFYKAMMGSGSKKGTAKTGETEDGKGSKGIDIGEFKGSKFGNFLDKISGVLGNNTPKPLQNLAEKLAQDFEQLQKRNELMAQKLMDMLKNNPDEALKYALPLDGEGSSRGHAGTFDLDRRFGDLNLFGNWGRGYGGGSVDLGDKYWEVRRQYVQMAEDYIKKNDYKRAAFVHMRLLGDKYKAAQILQEGGYYQDAAKIYLDYLKNKGKAAECYEEGRYYKEAIELRKDLKQFEFVGDLYTKVKDQSAALTFFNKAVNLRLENRNFQDAARIYRNKMNEQQLAQETLLKGWKENKKASVCLEEYFDHINDKKELKKQIHQLNEETVNANNANAFLDVAYKKVGRDNEMKDYVDQLSYQLIAKYHNKNRAILQKLKTIHPKDKVISKDIGRYR